jgi:hypothetical protein
MILKIYTETKQELTGTEEYGFIYFDGVTEVFPKIVDLPKGQKEVTLTFYDQKGNYRAFLLNKYAYLMNDFGKTIETIAGSEQRSSDKS